MKINFENTQKNKALEYSKFTLIGFLFIFIHLYVINYFEIYGVVPDILLFLGVSEIKHLQLLHQKNDQ